MHVRRPIKTRCVLSQQLTMTTSKWQAVIQKEGRIELALQVYQQSHFSTSITAAKMYNVTQSTLQCYIVEGQSKLDSITKNHLLMSIKEESLVQWILSMNKCNMLSRIATVWEITHLLVVQHKQSTTVDQLWVHNFIKCHDMLKLKYNHKYNY